MIIKDYADDDRARWNAFVARSKNGTFLFDRDYMDYHADRYHDASLLALDDDGRVQALFPATRRDHEVISHEGLTYGGFVTDERMTVEVMLDLFRAAGRHFHESGVRNLTYKAVPHIYHRSPAEEDLYALAIQGAALCRRDVLSVIDYEAEIDWDDRRRRRAKKAAKAIRSGVEVRETDDYDGFWTMLAENLERRHRIDPVHTRDELKLLAARFPEQIRLYGAFHEEVLAAGALLYLSPRVCHVQYSASTLDGRQLRALDLVLAHLIDAFHGRARYFDFGISTERDGRMLNTGLVEYKQQFGARTVVHDFYRWVPAAQ
jgi:hypothetical protein